MSEQPPFWPPPPGWKPGDVQDQAAPATVRTRTIIEAAAICAVVFIGLASFIGVVFATAGSTANSLIVLVVFVLAVLVLPAVVGAGTAVHYLRSRRG